MSSAGSGPVVELPPEAPRSTFNLDEALAKGTKHGSTDLHVRANDYPIFRVHGRLLRDTAFPKFTPETTKALAMTFLTDYHKNILEENGDVDLAYTVEGLARFRVNVFYEREMVGIAFRLIPFEIPDIDRLGIPWVAKDLSMKPRGLVLVTGPTGSGKSTTLASMIRYINMNTDRNIITIEDPIEYKHDSIKSVVVQREVGADTVSFQRALRSALRQDPDVILLGEMRDLETIQTALTAAETGHLVFATLHTTSAMTSVDRVIDVFPPAQQAQIRLQMANVLQGILSQALLPRKSGGRIVAVECLVADHGVRNLIREGKVHQIATAMESGAKKGMQTLDMALKKLLKDDQITIEVALGATSNPQDFRDVPGAAA
ncbi:MAG TPA: type IV pilus twitching motility protein PilT, partial [bacterium]|nr:type IV pilus twitching motility protein PilT [bacterium]